MAVRISDLPPLTGSLEDGDILELSELSGGTYVSRSVAVSSFKTDLFDFIQEDFLLSSIDILSGAVILSQEPRDPDTIIFDIDGAATAIRGYDWDVDGLDSKKIVWAGYQISGTLAEGDLISIKYIS